MKILSVDDSKTIRMIVKRSFAPYDVTLLEACNGAEGLAAATAEKPDLIVLDVTMPVMDGVTMLTKIKENADLKNIPVIMLTSESSRENVIFIAKLGVFSAAAASESYALLIVGVVASVIAAFFYLRVIIVMYASEATEPQVGDPSGDPPGGVAGGDDDLATSVRVDVPTAAVLAICVAFTLWVGVLPGLILDFARDATLIF